MSSTTTSTSNKLNRKPFTPILSSAATTSAVCPPSTTSITPSERALVKQHDPDSMYPILRQPLSPDRPSTTAGLMSVQRELEFAKAELAREQAQRKLDRQKADQVGWLILSALCYTPCSLALVYAHLKYDYNMPLCPLFCRRRRYCSSKYTHYP